MSLAGRLQQAAARAIRSAAQISDRAMAAARVNPRVREAAGALWTAAEAAVATPPRSVREAASRIRGAAEEALRHLRAKAGDAVPPPEPGTPESAPIPPPPPPQPQPVWELERETRSSSWWQLTTQPELETLRQVLRVAGPPPEPSSDGTYMLIAAWGSLSLSLSIRGTWEEVLGDVAYYLALTKERGYSAGEDVPEGDPDKILCRCWRV